jgi:hypothetical protein
VLTEGLGLSAAAAHQDRSGAMCTLSEGPQPGYHPLTLPEQRDLCRGPCLGRPGLGKQEGAAACSFPTCWKRSWMGGGGCGQCCLMVSA